MVSQLNRPDIQAIPGALKVLSQWVCWCWEERDGKWSKPPVSPVTGRRASVTDPLTWGTFDQAVEFYEGGKADGIGFVFSASDPFCGIDLDECRDPETGAIDEWAHDAIHAIAGYTEISPSGTGLHVIIRARLHGQESGRRKGHVEFYDRARYFCMTGWVAW